MSGGDFIRQKEIPEVIVKIPVCRCGNLNDRIPEK